MYRYRLVFINYVKILIGTKLHWLPTSCSRAWRVDIPSVLIVYLASLSGLNLKVLFDLLKIIALEATNVNI
ncbi:hypothetical protein E0485_22230 [Paenibacillus albiflavus]|uniref:Uncharacterized protein n=1 Tax=Paenibacillus albiflavus TaxID=2545760 RepID=A0A4R4E4Z7_9BACL|nr:hypothetical protein [Paenibacillus albiflavus]TCZ72310.1 hypothetical protein E0485_22230 [Paenibacillus albiflavus]